ncbi:MAG: histidine--tRNA ligase [Verrucomicrobia bacterium]|nr:histidine--tRNA ligase [Verrucomicrobiota bacterium]
MDRLPGFRDFYPDPVPHQDLWSADLRNHIFDTWRAVARRYGFREYDGPPLEPLELYTQKSGDEIVGQLYNFVDKGERAVALRPEMTPTLARMVAAHARNYKKPIKWFALPQLFRYERQQKGRLREHFQFNADLIGETDPAADAEIIALLIDALRTLKLTANDFIIRLSSRNAWQDFFRRQCPDEAKAYDFYQVVDKLDREEPAQSDAKLRALGFSLDAVKAFITAAHPTAELDAILTNLAARGLADFVKLDYGVIRGLAYYTGPVFEAFDKKGEFRAIAGGGRYDNLVKHVSAGKADLPCVGFGMGVVVLTELRSARGLVPAFAADLDVFVVVEEESLRADSLRVVQQLRDSGLRVELALAPGKADKQFKRALDLRVRRTLKLERTADGTLAAQVKHLQTREEKTASLPEVIAALSLQ